jgi:hypothetical protein
MHVPVRRAAGVAVTLTAAQLQDKTFQGLLGHTVAGSEVKLGLAELAGVCLLAVGRMSTIPGAAISRNVCGVDWCPEMFGLSAGERPRRPTSSEAFDFWGG